MADLASLGLQIDSTQVSKGVGELDKLTAAGARAESGMKGVGASLNNGQVKSATEAARAYSTSLDLAAASSGKGAASFSKLSAEAHISSTSIRELLVLTREASTGNFTRMAGSASILAQQLQASGMSASEFGSQLLRMTGILKVTADAELAAEASSASAAAQAIASAAERAEANVLAADTEIALAAAAKATAATAAEGTAASARLAAAHADLALASREATVAQEALATANEAVANTASAAAEAETVALAPLAGVLGAVAIAAGLAFGAFKSFQFVVSDSGELDKYVQTLGLTERQIKNLQDVSITFGDVMKGVWDTIADHTGADRGIEGFKRFAVDQFRGLLKDGIDIFAELYGDIVGTYRAVIVIWENFPAAFGDIFVSGVNSAIEAINGLVKKGSELLNGFIDNANKLPFVNIAHVAAPQIDGLVNTYKGAASKVAGALSSEIKKATAEGKAAAQGIVADLDRNIISEAEKRLKEQADPNKARNARKPSDHGLADALAELDAQIKGQNALAAAYQISDAAAIKAEAHQKAEEQAIRHKGDVGLFYEKELALAVATRAAEGAKTINQLSGQTTAQRALNDQVSAGTIAATQAAAQLKDEAALRPLLAAYAVAEGSAKTNLAGIIARLRKEQEASNAEANRAQVLAATAASSDNLDKIKLEATLIGQTNSVRAVAIAQLEAEQYLRAHPGATADEAQKYIDGQKAIAQGTADLSTAQDNFNRSLSYTADLLSLINDNAQTTATSLADAFGNVGQGVGQALTALTGYAAAQAKLDQDHKAALKAAGNDAAAAAKIDVLYAKQSSNAKQQATLQAIDGIKHLFNEHSKAYKVMSAIEKAYAAFQAAETIASIARDVIKTTSSLANSAVRTTANTAEGGSKIFAELGPWAFPVVAAMVAVIAALGFSSGGGGGSSGPVPQSAEDAQAAQGSGTVLGSSKAQSESIAHALDIVAANSNKDLEYSNEMLRSLRSIDTSIGKLAGTVAQQIQVSGSLYDTSKLNLGSTGKGGFLGIGAKSTTRSLYDLGLTLGSTSVASIIANGISGSTYQIVEQITKKSGFLGIGGGTKTSYQTTTGQIDPAITSAVQDVVKSLRDGLLSAASVIGLQGAQAILDSFQVNIGKISFKDMTGDEIESTLQAVFSKVGDQMAGALLPTLTTMQKVGEGLFETFIRVAREYEVVDTALKSIGKTFGAVGLGSVAARDALVQLFGSLDDFAQSTDFFRDQFLSTAEQISPVQSSVVAELKRLGVAGITTRDQFKQAVLGLDLTTDAGRQMYASLLAVAPAFDKVLDYFDELNKTAISGLQSTVDQFSKFVDSLTKYRDTLFATGAAQGNAYETLRKQFLATAALAAGGDATALGGLEASGKAFLDASKNNASTLQDYQRDIAIVAQGVDKGIFAAESTADYAQLQLDALKNATSILQQISANTQATATALAAQPVVAAPAGTAPTGVQTLPSNEGATLVQQNQTIIDQNAKMLEFLRQQGLLWSRFEGDGLTIKTDPDTPLSVVAV